MLALLDIEPSAADRALALIGRRPSGAVLTEHSRMAALLLPGGVICEQSWVVVAPAPPPAEALHLGEGVVEGVTIRPDHPTELDICRRPTDLRKCRPEEVEQRDVARADDLPRGLPDPVRIRRQQIIERPRHPARVRHPKEPWRRQAARLGLIGVLKQRALTMRSDLVSLRASTLGDALSAATTSAASQRDTSGARTHPSHPTLRGSTASPDADRAMLDPIGHRPACRDRHPPGHALPQA